MSSSVQEKERATFLKEVFAIDVDAEGAPSHCPATIVNRAAGKALASGFPVIENSDDDEEPGVAMAVPVYRGGKITSLFVIVGEAADSSIGVMEIWQPVGEYDELNLTSGYFSGLDRFQNVSSFVRFEKGSGMPGQVWRNLSFVVHDDLPRHPGFLRAAGASAESLQVAVGMPVFSDQFLASAILISSDVTPIARGFEVWRHAEGQFLLESIAYQSLPDPLRMKAGTALPIDGSLPGLSMQNEGVSITEDRALILCGREKDADFAGRAVAIPFYEDERLTNVLTLLL